MFIFASMKILVDVFFHALKMVWLRLRLKVAKLFDKKGTREKEEIKKALMDKRTEFYSICLLDHSKFQWEFLTNKISSLS